MTKSEIRGSGGNENNKKERLKKQSNNFARESVICLGTNKHEYANAVLKAGRGGAYPEPMKSRELLVKNDFSKHCGLLGLKN